MPHIDRVQAFFYSRIGSIDLWRSRGQELSSIKSVTRTILNGPEKFPHLLPAFISTCLNLIWDHVCMTNIINTTKMAGSFALLFSWGPSPYRLFHTSYHPNLTRSKKRSLSLLIKFIGFSNHPNIPKRHQFIGFLRCPITWKVHALRDSKKLPIEQGDSLPSHVIGGDAAKPWNRVRFGWKLPTSPLPSRSDAGCIHLSSWQSLDCDIFQQANMLCGSPDYTFHTLLLWYMTKSKRRFLWSITT